MLRFAQHPRVRHYVCALAAFALAIIAKPSAVVAPVIAAVLVWWGGSVRLGIIIRWISPMLLLGVACVVWSRLVQAEHPPAQTTLWARPLIALDALAFYLLTLFWPVDLRIIYGRTPRWVLDQGAVAWAWLIPTAAGAAAWLLRRRIPLVAAGLLVFVIGLLPTLGFFPFEFQVHSTVADHYLYLPMLGVGIAVAGVVAAGPRKLMLSGTAIILLGLSVLSIRQIQFWRDSQTLFGGVLRYHPENLVARDGLAKAYATQGRLADAIEQFRLIVAAVPDNRLARANLAQALMIAGDFRDAVAEAQRALQLARPGENTSREHYLLGRCFMSMGDLDAAVYHFEQRLAQNPDQSAREDLEEARRRRDVTWK
jgi:hypothetical protein